MIGRRLAPALLAVFGSLVVGAQAPAPATLSLRQAIALARRNSPLLLAARTGVAIAGQARRRARAALLPSVSFTTQYLYTEGNDTPSGRFIANNAVHEYLSQADVHQTVFAGGGLWAGYHRAQARQRLARAREEIAARGLVATVVDHYYGLLAAQHQTGTAQIAVANAKRFVTITQERERAGEVAQADVIKAEFILEQRRQALQAAELAETDARLNLALLLFPNIGRPYRLRDDLNLAPPLPTPAAIAAQARLHNPQLAAAMANLQSARAGVTIARAGLLPTVSLDYWYGIDAAHFATETGSTPNLGNAAAATITVPIWDWGARRSRLATAQWQRRQARRDLDYAQRQLLTSLAADEAAAAGARAQLASLRQASHLAAESLRLALLRYRHGETTDLEVVDAENSLAQASNALIQGELAYRQALANLQTLTGSL